MRLLLLSLLYTGAQGPLAGKCRGRKALMRRQLGGSSSAVRVLAVVLCPVLLRSAAVAAAAPAVVLLQQYKQQLVELSQFSTATLGPCRQNEARSEE
jgi:hypothetical protein